MIFNHSSLVCVTAILACGAANAQYKCITPTGSIAFQQTPCERNSKEQRLDLKVPAPPSPVASRPESPDERLARTFANDRQKADAIQRRQELRSQIDGIDNAIAARNRQMSDEVAALQSRKGRARNNLAGATWEQSLSTEMQAVTDKYRALNESDRERQRALRAQLESSSER